ncbi:MAG: Ig-like domain-containing protein, partial [Ruminococcus sp.]|nr:Ig-like domain-containing protein [Ruminococcus sp.]
GAGGYPAGEYYITGVTVRNNKISTGGNAVYLEQVRNVNVIENEMTCSKSKFATKTCNPLTTLNCAVASVSGNIVKSSSEQGFEIAISTVKSITGNHIANVKIDGILLEAESRVTEKISGNIITKAARYGLNLRPKCGGGTVSGNIIYDCAKGAIQKEKTATGTVGDNYYEIAEMSKLTLNTQSATLGAGETFALSTSYEPANAIADMQWTSSDPKVANVSTKGVITAQQYGEADISVKSGKKTASCHVKVMPAPESIKLSANMLTIGYGEKVDLDGRLTEGTFSHSITYTSNNKNAVTVNSSDGVIKGVGTGTATIIAKTFNGKHAACNVIVKSAPDDIWFDSRELDLGIGEKALLHVNLPDGSASHAMKWHSDNEAVIKVTEHGELSALDVGEATVTATAFNGAKAICYVTVLDAPDKVRFAEEVYTLTAGDSMTPTVYFPEGAISHALQFQSSDPDICRVNKLTGELTAKKSGIVTITVKTFNRRFTSCTVVVHSSAAGTSGGYE